MALAAAVASTFPRASGAQDGQGAPAPAGAPPAAPDPAAPVTLDFNALSARMQERASRPYEAPENALPEEIAGLSYDQHRSIRFRPDRALWREAPVNFHLQAFYPGWVFKETTRIYIGNDGAYTLHQFNPPDFEYRAPLDPAVFDGLSLPGVAGFRIHAPLERPDYFDELVTFLGASYFRALGMGTRYGLSARGLAINTATSDDEEFPRFSAFYVDRPKPGDVSIRIMAELDSPSLAGAYFFDITPGPQTVMLVTCRLYFRNEVTRLGIAPLTSMFTFGENDRAGTDDFRPEVHDSDGLSIHRGNGEHVWRPLSNPDQLALSFMQETNPLAFGLLQRDREFSHYEDTEARYEIRPSLMVEPLDNWGKGTIQLVEIPTNSEANDNIVAFWVPEAKPAAGGSMEFRYRMRWGLDVEERFGLATVSGTFVGVGGNAADANEQSTRRFAVNFEGGTISNLPADAVLEPVVDVPANAKLVHTAIARLPHGGWRLSLELQKLDSAPVELRAKLSMLQRIVSETWLYQWTGTPS
ncbi:glucan biosynthesis protein G [Aurantimonas sp. Leaf443]|uniref:glucan biosynthesis protein n=1 Tax=Aurantimonas sp. Leaf443 TaxID=1736378 RepID=UPI001FCCE4C7|nr:glucan biosynthesis protein G [Aurantimonas sp. Leaf443]